jgi:hypothetical protein
VSPYSHARAQPRKRMLIIVNPKRLDGRPDEGLCSVQVVLVRLFSGRSHVLTLPERLVGWLSALDPILELGVAGVEGRYRSTERFHYRALTPQANHEPLVQMRGRSAPAPQIVQLLGVVTGIARIRLVVTVLSPLECPDVDIDRLSKMRSSSKSFTSRSSSKRRRFSRRCPTTVMRGTETAVTAPAITDTSAIVFVPGMARRIVAAADGGLSLREEELPTSRTLDGGVQANRSEPLGGPARNSAAALWGRKGF